MGVVVKMVRSLPGKIVLWGIIAAFLLISGVTIYRQVLRSLYPIHYRTEIQKISYRLAVDPFLTASIIRIESGFNPNAVSSKGAKGLMQIVPSTGRWIANRMNIAEYDDDLLMNPDLNIKLGTWYMAELKREFGQWPIALAAYNAGRGNVRKWLKSGRWDGTLKGLDTLPFLETRVYVRRVLNAYHLYKRIYHNNWPRNENG